MSKFRARIRDVGHAPGGFGFAALASQERPRHVLVVAAAASAAEARAALDAGADVVLVEDTGALKAAAGGRQPVGIRLLDATGADVKAAHEAGADFFLFDDATTHASAIAVPDVGRVLRLGADQDEQRLRAVGAIDLDAVLVAADPGAITVRDQVALRRVASLVGSPLLIEASAPPDAGALEAWRDAGAPAVLVPAAQVAATVEAAKQVPPARRRVGDRPVAILGAPPSGRDHEHEHDDEDDD
jgi:hypothetical protein